MYLMKHEYYKYLSYIASNVRDEQFTKQELYDIKQLAIKLQTICTEEINRIKSRGE